MGQKGYIRLVVAAVQVIVTFAAVAGAGTWLAAGEHQRNVSAGLAELSRAHHDFQGQSQSSLADGTPADILAELTAREDAVMKRPVPQATFPVDRKVAAQLQDNVAAIKRITEDVRLREVEVEESLSQQLGTALDAMNTDRVAARDLGIDTAGFDTFMLGALRDSVHLRIPRDAQTVLDATKAKDGELQQVIAAKVAANAAAAAAAAAMQASKDNAAYQRGRAIGDLAQAQAIPVLDVAAAAAAIADLEKRYPLATTQDDFDSVAAGYAAQARVLENLLYTRSATYRLLDQARAAQARAQSAGADVTADAARIADIAARLDRASNLATMQEIGGELSLVIRDLTAAYFEARSRPFVPAGAIINNVPFDRQIYSLSCEEASLQMALGKYGINVSQDAVLAAIGEDRRPPYFDSSGTLHWGNPYTTFVGNPNGFENATSGDQSGYGTYFSPIASAATHFGGHVQQAGEGVAPSIVYNAARNGQPAVVWVAFAYQPQPMHYMITFDNRTVMYGAPYEHAVTVAGWAPGYVLINNPHSHPEWIDGGTFERAYAMFNDMAVILQPNA